MNNLSLLMIIASKTREEKYLNLLNQYEVSFKALAYGRGTASSSLLNYFGLTDVERMVIFAVLPRITSKYVLKELKSRLRISKPGNGIAFTIPLSSSTKYMQEFYQKQSLEDFQMETSNKHLIITIASEGFAEMVMNAAKKAGATGGTALNGRGLDTEKIIKFLGISIAPEKDIVLILAEDVKKNKIMDSIIKVCGLKTPGAGICFAVPVDFVAGLNKELEEN